MLCLSVKILLANIKFCFALSYNVRTGEIYILTFIHTRSKIYHVVKENTHVIFFMTSFLLLKPSEKGVSIDLSVSRLKCIYILKCKRVLRKTAFMIY